MALTRLDSDERRKAIVAAAVPLFARKGFAGTTTRELAEAAGISEALLFRHFPTKQLLYREIMQLGCEGEPELEKLASLPPSTASLVQMVTFMVRRFVLADTTEGLGVDERLRLVLHSWLEDGAYARELFERIFEQVHPAFVGFVEAAVAAGDMRPSEGATANRFWFSHHIAATIACSGLPGRSCFAYEGAPDRLIEEAVVFILRGIGLTDAAIAAHTVSSLPSAAD
jgi:TetR/AcrR family transcriptional regulator, transcriptional repressor of aconitase